MSDIKKKKSFVIRDYKRIPVLLEKLNELWLFYPDLRFGQVFLLLESRLEERHKYHSYHVEDDKWLEVIEVLIKEAKNNK